MERSYNRTTFFLGMSLYANKQISKLCMVNSNGNELTVIDSYL